MRFTPEQLVSKLTTPTGRSTGSMPIEMHVKTMNMPGRKKMKMRRTGFLFIVIQFLINRAEMLDNEGKLKVLFIPEGFFKSVRLRVSRFVLVLEILWRLWDLVLRISTIGCA